LIGVARRDAAKQFVDPAFVRCRHLGESSLALGGQAHERGTPVAIALRPCDQTV